MLYSRLISAAFVTDGIVYSDGMKKAEILNDQFSSVYTKEDSPPPTDLSGPSSYPDMPSMSCM